MAQLIGLAFALACLLFTLSLPLGGATFAKSLRKAALFLFILALGPSLFFGALKESLGASGSGSTSAGPTDVLAALGGLALLSVGAYIALQVRKRSRRGERNAMTDFYNQRSTGKRPVRREDQEGPGFPLF